MMNFGSQPQMGGLFGSDGNQDDGGLGAMGGGEGMFSM